MRSPLGIGSIDHVASMPRHSGSFPPRVSGVTEERFHSAMTAGLARAELKLGTRKALAYVMDMTAKAVGHIFAGGMTNPKALWDVRLHDPSALDDIADLYGCRIVPKESVCSVDGRLSVVVHALLGKAILAEIDGHEDHQETLDMESELRAVRALVDERLERIAALRRRH